MVEEADEDRSRSLGTKEWVLLLERLQAKSPVCQYRGLEWGPIEALLLPAATPDHAPDHAAAPAAGGGDEVRAAQQAAIGADDGVETIFDRILRQEIPAHVVYEDELCLAFRDSTPQAPVHILIIPKLRDSLTRLSRAEERHKEILGHLTVTAAKIAKQEGLGEAGWRLVINDGRHGAQTVGHLHLHILGGRQMGWPPG